MERVIVRRVTTCADANRVLSFLRSWAFVHPPALKYVESFQTMKHLCIICAMWVTIARYFWAIIASVLQRANLVDYGLTLRDVFQKITMYLWYRCRHTQEWEMFPALTRGKARLRWLEGWAILSSSIDAWGAKLVVASANGHKSPELNGRKRSKKEDWTWYTLADCERECLGDWWRMLKSCWWWCLVSWGPEYLANTIAAEEVLPLTRQKTWSGCPKWFDTHIYTTWSHMHTLQTNQQSLELEKFSVVLRLEGHWVTDLFFWHLPKICTGQCADDYSPGSVVYLEAHHRRIFWFELRSWT